MEALIDATQVKELVTLIRATATDEAAFVKTMVSGAETLQDIRQRDFPRLIMALREKKQRRAQK
jgi:energy-converting hydrogenase Eha subunit B